MRTGSRALPGSWKTSPIPPPLSALLARRERAHVAPLEDHVARGDPHGRRNEVEQGEGREALPAAGLADERHDFPRRDVEGDAVHDGRVAASGGRHGDREGADGEERVAHPRMISAAGGAQAGESSLSRSPTSRNDAFAP